MSHPAATPPPRGSSSPPSGDGDPDAALDDLARLAARLCDAPAAAIALLEAGGLRLASRFGLETPHVPRVEALCARALQQADALVIEEAADGIGACAGVRLASGDAAIGVLCVVNAPDLDEDQRDGLLALARQVVGQVERRRAERFLLQEARTLALLGQVNAELASELDLGRLLQKITDAGTGLTGARFGALFYNAVGEQGEHYQLYTLSGARKEDFSRFPMPRNTAVFAPTFAGLGPVRSDDITRDPRYGRNSPHRGVPEGHLPVRSYLAVPVRSRSGEILGGLFFGHPEPGVFSDQAEQLAVGVAAQAAVAIDNARLYEHAERARRKAEAAEERLASLTDALPVLVSYVDRTLRYRVVNAAYESWFGRPREQLVGHHLEEVVAPELLQQRCHAIEAALAGERVSFEADTPHAALGVRRTQLTYIPDLRPDGEVHGFTVLCQDITERVRAVELRDEFLSIASHELRTPLTSLKLYLEMLDRACRREGEQRQPPERMARMLASCGRQVQQLEGLIDDLLDVSRISNGRLALQAAPTDLVTLVREVAERFAAQLAGAGNDLSLELPERLEGEWDPHRLDQVVANLLSNACKYGCGKPIRIRLGSHGGRAVLEVIDGGEGIPAEHQSRIFDRFERAGRGTGTGGLGLGLYIASQIVAAHGGRIWVDSQPGQGARFVVELPL